MFRIRISPAAMAIPLVLSLSACETTESDLPFAVKPPATEPTLTIMSRNLYLGADIDGVLSIQDPNAVPGAIARAWASVEASNFKERAEALALEVALTKPHLIGLQEATVYRRQSPSDFVAGNRAVNASVVVYDFVDILLSALAARNLNYRVVSKVVNSDLEFPMFTGTGPLPFDDIRYTDQDVILARADVATAGTYASNFEARVPVSIGGMPVTLLRGFVAVDAEVNGRPLRFVNTHLEVQRFRPVQEAQARQLMSWLADARTDVVLVGDLNSAANADAPAASRTASYDLARAAGYTDVWPQAPANATQNGLTCCHAADLRSTTVDLTQRIDFVLFKSAAGLPQMQVRGEPEVVGEELKDRTASGLWPSDHAGVVATLNFRRN